MGLSLQGLGAAAGAGAEGFRDQRADNREQAEENRTARDDVYNQTFNEIQAQRSALDDMGGGPTQTEAIPGGSAQSGAIPTGSSPAQQSQQSGFPSRRAAYKDWHKRSSAAAAMAGGLEGLKAFQDHESALSRKQMMGYGMAGVQSMAAGAAGEAVKQLNTMLEVSPEDTGMKFEAFDGKVHLVGADGKRSAAYSQDQVMAVIESKLKTPENYLAFQTEARQQGVADESVRAAQAGEKIDARNAAVSEREATVKEARQPAQTLLDKATAYYRLAAGRAALTPDTDVDGPEAWWGTRNLDQIEEMEADAKEGRLGFAMDGPWIAEDFKNTELFNDVMTAMKMVRMNNEPMSLTDNGAAEIARMAYFNDLDLKGKDPSTAIPPALANTKVFYDEDTGAWQVQYEGGRYLVPPEVGQRIHQNRQHLPTAE